MNEEVDIQQIQTDSLTEFEKMYRKYVKSVYSYVFKMLKNTADAEEIVQEVFINLWQKRAIIQSEKVVWIMAKRKCIDYMRKRKLFFLCPQEWASLYQMCSSEKEIICQDEQQVMINKLSMVDREVILLALKGSSRNEMATILEIPLGTIDSRLNRIRCKLRRE
ncbi:RNA polymerase sigma factor [Candidatus Uabimicrobium sp. HlEnr_7]|uniref:RNA polymerase sigma factor n=1 Tax=Candidatus Uabimicrobium helgolandensis TaxID=3095367 RepID=UPI003557C04D